MAGGDIDDVVYDYQEWVWSCIQALEITSIMKVFATLSLSLNKAIDPLLSRFRLLRDMWIWFTISRAS